MSKFGFFTISFFAGSRHSSAANSGQASHRTSTLWTTGPQSLPDHNGHRQNSKPVVGVAGDNGGPPSASTPSGGHDPSLNMPTATSKMQIGNSVRDHSDTVNPDILGTLKR